MISVSFSWFSSSESASVSGVKMEVTEGDSLLLKMGSEEDGVKDLEFDFDREYPLKAVSGNGKYFYDAILGYPDDALDNVEGDHTAVDREVLGYVPLSGLEDCEDYMRFGMFAYDFSMHIDRDTPVYIYPLSSDDVPSAVTPAPASDYPDGNNKSPYGDFDIGNVCGAMRVAILQKNAEGSYEPTFVWAPNTTIELYKDDDGALHVETDAEKVNPESKYIYLGEDSSSPIEISSGDSLQGSVVVDGVTYAWGALESKLKIGQLSGSTDNNFRFVAWVDGNDRECHNALLSGLIVVKLHFGL